MAADTRASNPPPESTQLRAVRSLWRELVSFRNTDANTTGRSTQTSWTIHLNCGFHKIASSAPRAAEGVSSPASSHARPSSPGA